jgi:ribosome-associated translation inhibitor RaiA
MPIDDSTTFEISTRGDIDNEAIERAKERLDRIGSHCPEPIIHVELRVTDDTAHPSQAHARAEATLSIKNGPVRAHAQAPTVPEAIDLMIERLRRRVDRHESRLHRVGVKRHDGVAAEGSWQHGDVRSAPRRPQPRRDDTATVVRRKTFAAGPMTVEEAAFDLDILDHDFYLFEESDSGAAGLLSLSDDGRYELAIAHNAEITLDPKMPLDRVEGPITLDQQGAQRLLDSGADAFIFHRVNETEPGQVMYRRYDGDYGVVDLGASTATPTDPA